MAEQRRLRGGQYHLRPLWGAYIDTQIVNRRNIISLLAGMSKQVTVLDR